MKKLFFTITCVIISITGICQLREIENTAFKRGEYLAYKVYYDAILTGKVVAGTCSFEIKNEDKVINNRSTYHVEAIGKTKGAFNLFFKVVDRYDTYIDEKTIAPWLFIRRVDEGGYIIKQDITFNQNKKVAYFKDIKSGRTATISTPQYVQDILSAIYYLRTYDFSKFNPNEEVGVKFMLDDTVFSTKVYFLGRETVNIGIGKIKCIKVKPQVLTGTVFKDPYPVLVWVSDDENKIPVIAQSEILVGSVKMELIGYYGLMNDFTALQK